MSTIKLNVGGVKIETYASTLLQLEYFKVKLERWNNEDTELFVDCDYDLFKHLVNKLRDASYEMPNNKNIENMCNYFGYTINEHKQLNMGYMVYLGENLEIKDVKIIDLIVKVSDHGVPKIGIIFTDINENTILKIKHTEFSMFFIKDNENMYSLRKSVLKFLQKIKDFKISINYYCSMSGLKILYEY